MDKNQDNRQYRMQLFAVFLAEISETFPRKTGTYQNCLHLQLLKNEK